MLTHPAAAKANSEVISIAFMLLSPFVRAGLDRMASCYSAARLLGSVDCVASHAEPHVEHEGVNQR
jgi:hypothetical protein